MSALFTGRLLLRRSPNGAPPNSCSDYSSIASPRPLERTLKPTFSNLRYASSVRSNCLVLDRRRGGEKPGADALRSKSSPLTVLRCWSNHLSELDLLLQVSTKTASFLNRFDSYGVNTESASENRTNLHRVSIHGNPKQTQISVKTESAWFCLKKARLTKADERFPMQSRNDNVNEET